MQAAFNDAVQGLSGTVRQTPEPLEQQTGSGLLSTSAGSFFVLREEYRDDSMFWQ